MFECPSCGESYGEERESELYDDLCDICDIKKTLEKDLRIAG